MKITFWSDPALSSFALPFEWPDVPEKNCCETRSARIIVNSSDCLISIHFYLHVDLRLERASEASYYLTT